MKRTRMLLIAIYSIRRCALSAAQVIACLLLTSMAATLSAQAQTFTVVHTFNGAPDGAVPSRVVKDAAGNLYGTTQQGGITAGVCTNIVAGMNGCGTVFKLDPTGTETVLYQFTGGTDGQSPTAGLVRDAAGNLYGSSSAGVFKLDATGKFTVLHSPGAYAGLVMDAGGNLYGSSSEGIFKIDAAGKFTVLDSSAYSNVTLALDAAGNLYGTNQYGGNINSDCLNGSCGIVFKLDTAGTYTVLHSFNTGGDDGYNPIAGVVLDAAGDLYGTTQYGGTPNCTGKPNNRVGCGIVFKLSPSGHESIFPISGGHHPITGVVLDSSGNLYGTTEWTGAYEGTSGLLFKMNSLGQETDLFTFTGGGLDRTWPTGDLVLDAAGNLYGNTDSLVFKLNPAGAPTFPFDVAPAGTGAGTVTASPEVSPARPFAPGSIRRAPRSPSPPHLLPARSSPAGPEAAPVRASVM
jgi:uncharacterized repeat protein (TIGR03803 family)